MNIKLCIDGKNIELNRFVVKFLSGTILGAVASLREIEDDWKQMELNITR